MESNKAWINTIFAANKHGCAGGGITVHINSKPAGDALCSVLSGRNYLCAVWRVFAGADCFGAFRNSRSVWFGPGAPVQFLIPGTTAGMIGLSGRRRYYRGYLFAAYRKAKERIGAEAQRLRESERSLEAEITERKRTEEELKRLSYRNKLILESAGEGIWGVDTNGIVTFINKTGASSLGYDVNELVGKPSHATWHYNRPDGAPYPSEECPIYAAYKDGVDHTGEETFWRKDGSGFPVDFTSRPIIEEGRITGAVVTFRDITGRKRAEEERERLIGELQRSNTELEQFAYVASHDLQEPLRMVGSYTTLLQKRYKEQLDEKAREYIHFAVDGARTDAEADRGTACLFPDNKAGRGIQTGRSQQGLFHGCFESLGGHPGKQGRDHERSAPTISGDETQLVQLFQNLIGNGVKYRKPESLPRVHVSAKRDGRNYVFSVKDNGIGIEPEYYERIFQIFQRLHTRANIQEPASGLRYASESWSGIMDGSGLNRFRAKDQRSFLRFRLEGR